MKSNNVVVFLFIILLSGCGSGGDKSASSGNSSTLDSSNNGNGAGSSSSNVLAITVNGSLCSSNSSYPNKPCVSVTICTPGTSTCQTIDDILLDTGSYGLRIFKQALTVSLPQVADGSGSLAECVQFGDGSSLWGPVQAADIFLGNEPSVRTSIQVLNAGFAAPPAGCRNADASPSEAGFNGILGVGLFANDCGAGCSNKVNNGVYYSCIGTSCSGTTVSLSSQVQNPVALLPEDNNGVIVQLPAVSSGGSASVGGSLILGIGTRTNNIPAAVATYTANQNAEFTTSFSGSTYSNSFLDTGSNALFFPSPSRTLLPDCGSSNSGWFCPATTTSLSALTSGYSGSSSGEIAFKVANANSIFNSSYNVFPELGGSMSGGFDWGLPFFLGRSVYLGIDGTSSSLGTGPYWAY